jgi:hypothetical protein
LLDSGFPEIGTVKWSCSLSLVTRPPVVGNDYSRSRSVTSQVYWNPIERTTQAPWVTMSLLRLLQSRLEAEGSTYWWSPPPWDKKKERPSVLDIERLLRRHRPGIQRLLSEWLGDEGEAA